MSKTGIVFSVETGQVEMTGAPSAEFSTGEK